MTVMERTLSGGSGTLHYSTFVVNKTSVCPGPSSGPSVNGQHLEKGLNLLLLL